jgi:YVTN family beta-propeller protein
MKKMALLVSSVVLALAVVANAADTSYKPVAKFAVGGEGGWDYITFDADGQRLFIAHNKTIEIIDAGNGKSLGQVPADGAHGVAVVTAKNEGFSTNGRAGTVTVFDLKAYKPMQDIKVGDNPDAIIFDPYSKRVIVMNGRSKDVSVIDPESLKVTNTVPLGGKLEFAAADEGHVYVNVEDTAEIADLDSKNWTVLHRWKLTGCEEPSGLALDAKSKHLFAVCGNKQMVIVDAKTGQLLQTLTTGDGTDGAAYDPGLNLAFASNGEGTLTVVSQAKDGKYQVAANVTTQRGARTVTVDPKTHRVFLPTAEFGPPAEGQRRPQVKPGTFTVLVLGQ